MRDISDSRTLPLPLPANHDLTGRRVVRKGCTVEWGDAGDGTAFRVKVERVREGMFWHSGWSQPSFTPCCRVRVVHA